jgi:hypothetical protein
MTIEIRPQDTSTLIGYYRDVPAPSTYFRDLLVASVFNSENEYIDFEKLVEGRRLAPLVIPTAQGRPMWSEASKVFRFKPAYVKPKDPVNPSRAFKRRPGEGIFTPNTLSPYQRYLQILGDILRMHREAIERRLEWLCSQAAIYGKVTLEAPDYPKTIVDFGRDPANTIVLSGAGIVWSDVNAPIVDNLNAWIEQIRRQPFGGPVTRLTLGSDVVGPFLRNLQVKETLNVLKRGTAGELNTDIRTGDYDERLGKIGNLEIYATSDWYDLPEGAGTAKFMPANGALLTGPNLNMIECYGAILDVNAQLRAMPVFPRQWNSDDPAVTYVMTQSSPLEVPVNPNNSLFATVI